MEATLNQVSGLQRAVVAQYVMAGRPFEIYGKVVPMVVMIWLGFQIYFIRIPAEHARKSPDFECKHVNSYVFPTEFAFWGMLIFSVLSLFREYQIIKEEFMSIPNMIYFWGINLTTTLLLLQLGMGTCDKRVELSAQIQVYANIIYWLMEVFPWIFFSVFAQVDAPYFKHLPLKSHSNVPRMVFEELDASIQSQQDTCAICMNKFEKRTRVDVLPCSHVFHPQCITQWTRSKNTCPYCRQSIQSGI